MHEQYYLTVGNKDKTITSITFYSSFVLATEASKKFISDNSNTENQYIQIGLHRGKSYVAYERNLNHDWVALNEPAWSNQTISEQKPTISEQKPKRLYIRVSRSKDMSFKMGWGWANAVTDLFQKQLGVVFIDLQPKWQDHVDRSKENKTTYTLRYTCKIPDTSIDKLKRVYGVEIV